jgi:MFS transporter, FHS family, glucose/mannose:H+ symporter
LRVLSRNATIGGFVAFTCIGAIQAMYGPAYLMFSKRFELSSSLGFFGNPGLIVSAHFAGSVLGITAQTQLEKRLGTRLRLSLSSLLLVLGCLGVALAPTWILVLLAAFVMGLGFGGIDVSINNLFSSGFGERGAAMSNIVNALFGVGAIVGPLLIGLIPGNYGIPFLIAAAFSVLVLFLFFSSQELDVFSAKNERSSLQNAVPINVPVLSCFLLLFWTYVLVEVGAASSETTHLVKVFSWTEQNAAFVNSLFWGGLALGRMLIAPFTTRFSPSSIVLGSVILVAASLSLTGIAPIAPIAYTLAGIACGPIFPTGFVWMSKALGGGLTNASIVIASANFGGVATPAVIELLSGKSVQRLPIAYVIVSAMMVFSVFLIGRLSSTKKLVKS